MKKKAGYFIERRVGKRWVKTWWTDNDAPEEGETVTRDVRPAMSLSGATRKLSLAHELYPDTKYRIVAVDECTSEVL